MRHMFAKSHETARLIEFFCNMKLDSPISFAEASKILRFPVTSSLSAYNSARKIVERDHSVVIGGVQKFGFVRLTGDKIAEQGERGLRSIRRSAKRSALKQEIAIGQNLDQQHMLRASELLGRFRIIADTAAPPRSNRAIVEAPQQEAPVDIRDRLKSITR